MVPPTGGTAWCRQRAARYTEARLGGGRRGKALRGLAGTPGGALWNRLANRPGRSPPGNRRAARRPAGFRRMSCGAGRALDRRADPAAAGTPAAACNGCRSAACLHAGATAPAETVPAGTVPGITAPGTVPPSMVPPDIVPPEWCLLVWCSLLAARYSEARYQAALFLAARYTEARCVVPPIGGTVPGALCPPGQSAGRRREWCRPVGRHGVPPIRSGRRAVVRRLLPAGTCRRGDRPGGGGGGWQGPVGALRRTPGGVLFPGPAMAGPGGIRPGHGRAGLLSGKGSGQGGRGRGTGTSGEAQGNGWYGRTVGTGGRLAQGNGWYGGMMQWNGWCGGMMQEKDGWCGGMMQEKDGWCGGMMQEKDGWCERNMIGTRK